MGGAAEIKGDKFMSENTSICIVDNIEIDTVAGKMDKIRQFQDLIKSQMVDGQDYGVIPGTSKPTLFKPGAEKILMLIGLTTKFDIIDSTRDFENGFFQYQVKCRMYKDGRFITEGLGACNTKESKYINRDPFSIDNTMLKMAKKRALVDAALLVASLSDLFTQDVEDMDFAAKPAPPEQPEAVQTPAPVPPYPNANTFAKISERQERRMFAISKGNRKLCHDVCKKYGYKNPADIKKADYESICAEIAQSA